MQNEDWVFGDIPIDAGEEIEEINVFEDTKKKEVKEKKYKEHEDHEAHQERQEEILTVEMAATYLKFRTETILRKIYAGEIKASKCGRVWRIKQSELDRYLDKNLR